jgi:hypothetical protein
MQAMGLVNDHLDGCDSREPAEHARAEFDRPMSSGMSAGLMGKPTATKETNP